MSGDAGIESEGINHLALVCRDMARTVAFYEGVLGMPLVKTVELPVGLGQHFFFDCGGGDMLAFFWFPEAADPVAGITGPRARPDTGEMVSAVGSMNHVAFKVSPERLEESRDRLVAAGVECSEVLNHDDSEWGVSPVEHPGVFVRSVYFSDPDGILLELAAWTRTFGPDDVAHTPATAADATPGRDAEPAAGGRAARRDRGPSGPPPTKEAARADQHGSLASEAPAEEIPEAMTATPPGS